MCDLTALRNWLLAVLLAILAAVGFIILAKIVNANPNTSAATPLVMVAAAMATLGAIVFVSLALSALTTFCACAGPRCSEPCNNLRTVLNGAIVVLGIQSTACLGLALVGLIPGLPQIPMAVILGTLLFQGFLILTAVIFMLMLASCRSAVAPPSP